MANRDMQDFDRMFAEDVDAQPIPYKLFGEVGTIPPSIPYGLVLKYQRLAKRNPDEEVEENSVHEMLCAIFGADVVERWSTTPMFDVGKMTKVLKWAMGQYGLNKEEAEEAPKTSRGKLRVVPKE